MIYSTYFICRWNYNYFPVTGVTTVCFCLWVFLQIIYLRIWNVAFCVSNCIIWTIVVFTCVTICLSIYLHIIAQWYLNASVFTERFYPSSRNVHSTWSTRFLSVKIIVIEISKFMVFNRIENIITGIFSRIL